MELDKSLVSGSMVLLVLREMGRNLEVQRDAFVQEGHSPKGGMGDPKMVGTECNDLTGPDPQWEPLAPSVSWERRSQNGGYSRIEQASPDAAACRMTNRFFPGAER